MATKIIINSGSDIDEKEAAKLGVIVIPMEVRIGEKEFLDGSTLSHEEFWEMLPKCEELPKTSQINPFRFEEYFDKIVSAGDEAVVITLSAKLSGTNLSACQAAEKYQGKIFVVDSLNASLGEKVLCLYAIKLLKNGLSAKEIAQKLEEKKEKVTFLAVLDTLKYLKKGGRISAVTAIAGEILSVKPMIEFIGGEIKMIGKGLGIRKAFALIAHTASKRKIDLSLPFGIVYSGTDKGPMEKFISDNAALWNGKTENLNPYLLGSTIGTHIGPGGLGIAFFEE